MALQTTGEISFSDINDEFGKYTNEPISLGDTEVRSLFGQTSGSVSINNAYSKTAPYFNLNVTSSLATTYDLYAEAVTAGWNEIQKLSLTLDSNGWIQGGLEIVGNFQRGVKVINDGHISGTGGKGGDRGYWFHTSGTSSSTSQHTATPATPGEPGGSAITVNCTKSGFPAGNPDAEGSVEIINNGTLSGGGGGGGASNTQFFYSNYWRSYYCGSYNQYAPTWEYYYWHGAAGGGGRGLNSQGGTPAVTGNGGSYGIVPINVVNEERFVYYGSGCIYQVIRYFTTNTNLTEGNAGNVNGVGAAASGHTGSGGSGGQWGQAGNNGTNTNGGAGGKTIYVTTGEVTIDLNTGTYNGTTYGL